MTTATHSERESFVLEVAKHCPKAQSRHLQRLMRYAGAYWNLRERQNKDWLTFTMRDLAKLLRIRKAITDICTDFDCEPVFGSALHLAIETTDWQKIVRVPCI